MFTDIEDDRSLTESESPVNVNIAVHEKLLKYERMYFKQRNNTSRYKRQLRNTLMKLKKRIEMNQKIGQTGLLKQLLNEDQVTILKRRSLGKSCKFLKWSNETVVNALRLKFSCGGSGYEELLRQKFPLPSVRTLQRRLQNLNFDSGILDEVLKFLDTKVQTFAPSERDCALVLDEMAITPTSVYDISLNKYLGEVTLPDHTGVATHVLVFMLAGIKARWKQVVGYFFTGNSVKGVIINDIIKNILQKVEPLGLNIVSVTSDMGAGNQALWKVWGITAGRHSDIKSKTSHLTAENKSVYVFADVPHLFKNIKAMLITNEIIRIPDDIKEKYELPSNEILSSHINVVVDHQKKDSFKLAPKISEEDLVPSHFQKMKVKTSTNVISHSVSSALKFLAEALDKPAYKTTAWFLDQVEKWFYLMTSRHPSCAISKMNPEIYNDSIEFLKNFMDIFRRLEVGHKKSWKPSQTGVLVSTESLLGLQAELLENRGYDFILTSRFSQDCLENLFCSLRAKQIVPNALEVKNNLKLIAVSQYLKNPNRSSYEEDDHDFLSGFLDTFHEQKPVYEVPEIPVNLPAPTLNLNYSELNSLYNICGYILSSIKKTSKTCQTCLDSAGSKNPLHKTFTKFTNLKQFKEKALFFCSEETFYLFLDLEAIFRKFIPHISTLNVNCKDFLTKTMNEIECDFLPNCHNLKRKIIDRYVVFRLKINYKKHKKATRKLASKSVAGHAL